MNWWPEGRRIVRPSLLFTIRTANRAPKPNYLAQTIASLRAGGVTPEQVHVFPTDPDVSWMPDLPGVTVHLPTARRTPNMNGLAPIALLDTIRTDWIILSEDDLAWCHNPLDTMARWLEDYARPSVLVYRFFAFDRLDPVGPHVSSAPLREQKGSQVIALRAAEAQRLAAWATAHPTTWRPRCAPFQDHPHTGFDKLVGYWALQEPQAATVGLVSRPFFVRHIGIESSLHRYGKTMDAAFAERPYEVRVCV